MDYGKCNCKLEDKIDNKTLETKKIEACDTCYTYENITKEEYVKVNINELSKEYSVDSGKVVYEVFEGCTNIERLQDNTWGCSVWTDVVINGIEIKGATWWNYSYDRRRNVTNLSTSDVQIYLNGTELFGTPLPDKFFTQVQGYYHSEHASELLKGSVTSNAGAGSGGSSLKMYSFAMKANKHQPTGTCNFSRLDNAHMVIGTVTAAPTNFYLYAVNFNVLRIKQGMGGLAFSN